MSSGITAGTRVLSRRRRDLHGVRADARERELELGLFVGALVPRVAVGVEDDQIVALPSLSASFVCFATSAT